MNLTISPVLTLSAVIHGLRGSVGAWSLQGWLNAALGLLLYRRLGEICGRMERLMARFEAGTLRRCASRAAPECAVRVRRAAPRRIWPSSFGWLVKAASWQAAGFGSQLRAALAEPKMQAMLAAAPQAARILRPLCRALAIETSVLHPDVAVGDEVDVKRVRVPRVTVDRVAIPDLVDGGRRWRGAG